MKTLLFFLLVTSVSAHSACNKKIDPNKIILFVDTNDSEMEIETAEKAACERGERVVVVPKNYKEYSKFTNAVKRYSNEIKNCRSSEESAKCADGIKKLSAARNDLSDFKSKQPLIPDAIKNTLKDIKDGKGKIQSLIISGHDGGGSFGGDKGDFSRHDFGEMLEDLKGINEIKSLLLLGCYTGVQKEVLEWKKHLPDVRFIAGYDDSAPLSTRPGGHKYLTELLMNEKNLLKQADQKKIQQLVEQNIASMYGLNSAMYLQCVDENKKEYYYGSKRGTRKFAPIDMKICENKKAIEELQKKVDAYFSGELEVPKDTARGELRQLYNLGRSMEHCFDEEEPEVNMHQIFNLLFYEGVKKSFGAFYKDSLVKVERDLNDLKLDDVVKSSESTIAQIEEDIKKKKDDLESLKNDPKAFQSKLEEKFNAANAELEKHKALPEFAQLYQQLSSGMSREMNPAERSLYDRYNKLAYVQYELKEDLSTLKSNEKEYVTNKEYQIEVKKEQVTPIREHLEKMKANPNFLKDIWVPTEKNLSTKTRKETLDNMHNIHGLLATQALPRKQRNQLTWLKEVTTMHLQHFENPFSWHEYNGHSVENPEVVASLTEFEKMTDD